MPDTNTRWILGAVLTIGTLILAQGSLTQARIADLQVDLAQLRTETREDLQRLDDRLRAVEVAVGKVEQRLETLERVALPTPDPAE